MTYLDWKASVEEWVNKEYPAVDAKALLDQIDWDAWIFQGGANPKGVVLDFTTAVAQKFEKLADDYITLGGESSPENYNDYLTTVDPQLKVIFLNRLLEQTAKVTLKLMTKIDADLGVTKEANPEIGQRWFPLALQHQYDNGAIAAMENYVSIQGRMKYINPVYTALVKNNRNDLAYNWFIKNQNFYHPIAIAQLRKIILG